MNPPGCPDPALCFLWGLKRRYLCQQGWAALGPGAGWMLDPHSDTKPWQCPAEAFVSFLLYTESCGGDAINLQLSPKMGVGTEGFVTVCAVSDILLLGKGREQWVQTWRRAHADRVWSCLYHHTLPL